MIPKTQKGWGCAGGKVFFAVTERWMYESYMKYRMHPSLFTTTVERVREKEERERSLTVEEQSNEVFRGGYKNDL